MTSFLTEAEIRREYAIDKQQRAYENRIRQLKQEERQLRACGMDKEAKALRKKWRVLTKDYQIYSLEHNRAYYPYRYVIDRSEEELDDGKVYAKWKKAIGEENMPKTLAEFVEIKYNKTQEYQQILRDIDLHRQYQETVGKGKVTDVGFVVFKETLQQARKRLVGITVNESVVEEVSIHLIERIIGSETEKRKGVSVEKVAQALEKGVLVKEKIDKQGRRGWTIHLDGVDVSYNPDKKMVIQCQPNTHRKVKK